MDANGAKIINLNDEINKIITDLLFNNNLENTIVKLGELLKVIISSNTNVYENANLYILFSLIEELNLSSPVLDILVKTIKYNSLSYKLLSSDENESKFTNQENIECCNPLSKETERYQTIEENPDMGIKTFYTFEKNLKTGEEKLIDKRVVKEPTATTLDGIFAGLLKNEIDKANKEEKLK